MKATQHHPPAGDLEGRTVEYLIRNAAGGETDGSGRFEAVSGPEGTGLEIVSDGLCPVCRIPVAGEWLPEVRRRPRGSASEYLLVVDDAREA